MAAAVWTFAIILWIAIGGIVAICVLALVKGPKLRERRAEFALRVNARLNTLDDFSPTQQTMDCQQNSGLAVDEPRKKICIINNRGGEAVEQILSCKDVLSVELFEDGASLTKTVRSSQVAGAVLGGLVLGGVGAVIGGLSGKTKTSGTIKHIDLRLIVNDTAAPVHDVPFMAIERKKNSSEYASAMKNARHWQGLIEVLIKRADAEDRATQIQEQRASPGVTVSSVADEIKKLAELYQTGALTREEFQRQKTRMLGGTRPTT